MKYKDLCGMTFGRLTVKERVENIGNGIRYRCTCECGKETIVYASNLRTGNTKSCGCLKDESISYETLCRLYRMWDRMREGIDPTGDWNVWKKWGIHENEALCEQWREDFLSFFNWSTTHGFRYGSTMFIHRYDVRKPFSPENCYFGDIDDADMADASRIL